MSDPIQQKLDEILGRLDRIEGKVDSLRNDFDGFRKLTNDNFDTVTEALAALPTKGDDGDTPRFATG